MQTLYNVSAGIEAASRITHCDTPWTRTRGLLGTRSLAPGHVFWIRPCNAIHTFFMLMSIDAVFLDDELRVVKAVPDLTPFRVCLPVRGATSVLEGAPGFIRAARLEKKGCRLAIRDAVADPAG